MHALQFVSEAVQLHIAQIWAAKLAFQMVKATLPTVDRGVNVIADLLADTSVDFNGVDPWRGGSGRLNGGGLWRSVWRRGAWRHRR